MSSQSNIIRSLLKVVGLTAFVLMPTGVVLAQSSLKATGEIVSASQVTINGFSAISGMTVFSNNRIRTGRLGAAIINLGRLGRIEFGPETDMTLRLSKESVGGELHSNHVVVSAGAGGLVRKSETSDVLVKAIKKVHAVEVWLDGILMARVLDEMWLLLAARQAEAVNPDHLPGPERRSYQSEGGVKWRTAWRRIGKNRLLTEREREIVGLIGQGLKNKEIADRLFISVVTVRHHLSSIFDKLEVSDRFGLAIYAFRYGLAEIPNGTNVLDAK